MNTAGLVCGLVFAVLMISFLAEHTDEKPKETKFKDNDEDEM